MAALHPIPFTDIKINDAFWSPILAAHRTATLKACMEQCQLTGRIANFEKAAAKQGAFTGIYFNDSDVYKVLEGVAYSLQHDRDPDLEAQADSWIAKIAAAQQPDGYLNTYYTLTPQEHRWTNMHKHEMYCAGHMMEAAIAYHQATGKDTFLKVAIRLADHIDNTFGPGKRHWVPGHEEIELALIKLYHHTGVRRYLALAAFLLDERGQGHGPGKVSFDGHDTSEQAYMQDHLPIRQQSQIEGHAVRAMYLYTAMADLAAVTGDEELKQAGLRIWKNLVDRRMYITGGVGSSAKNEGVTEDYDLPNDTAYCETCASVGMVMWNHRLNLLTGDAQYVDVLERALYNGALAGVSLSGRRFFYENPLASHGHHHRVPWFDCSCCPTQVTRFIPSIGQYVALTGDNDVYVNLYVQGMIQAQLPQGTLCLRVSTEYPWSGYVKIQLDMDAPMQCALHFRYPGWCRSGRLQVNGASVQRPQIRGGYMPIDRLWKPGDVVELRFEMPVERCHAHPKVLQNTGRVALQRGPLVYCVEETDNPHICEDGAFEPTLPERVQYITGHEKDLLGEQARGGITAIQAVGEHMHLKFVPYYVWDNREPGRMAVWVRES